MNMVREGVKKGTWSERVLKKGHGQGGCLKGTWSERVSKKGTWSERVLKRNIVRESFRRNMVREGLSSSCPLKQE